MSKYFSRKIAVFAVFLLVISTFGVLVIAEIYGPGKERFEIGTTENIPIPDFVAPVVIKDEKGRLQRNYLPKYVAAGFYPEFVGDSLAHIYSADPAINFPGIKNLPAEQQELALGLQTIPGLSTSVGSYIPGVVAFLRGKTTLAFLLPDLQDRGIEIEDVTNISDKEHEAISRELLRMFRIVVQTPGYLAQFPDTAQLNLKYVSYEEEVAVESSVEMTVKNEPGVYYFKNILDVAGTLQTFWRKVTDVTGKLPLYAPTPGKDFIPTELQVVGLSGFDDSTLLVDELPPVRGVVLTHQIFIGSHQVEYGWQWFGRPEGLYESQIGFLTP